MAYSDYTFYTGTYKGAAISQTDFDRLALRASEFIDQFTHDRAAPVVLAGTDTATITAVKKATCAVAERIQIIETGGGAIASEHSGSYSVNYLSTLNEDARCIKAAKRYLRATFLAYQGFNDGELGGNQIRTDLYPWGWP